MLKECNLTYDDIILRPQYSDIESRSSVDLSQTLDKSRSLKVPIIASPMDTVSNWDVAVELSRIGCMAVIHRYMPICEQSEHIYFFKKSGVGGLVGAAIGVRGDYLDRAIELKRNGVDLLCIDVAHAHSSMMRIAIGEVKKAVGDDTHIMVGNVATLKAVNDVADWGADSVRVGIGGGSVCTTRVKTGHGYPNVSSLLECSKTDRKIKIIADGGIRSSGDIVKAIACGADFVMLGSMIAGTVESPGKVITINGKKYKEYRGMASKAATGSSRNVEGVSSKIPMRGHISDVISDIVDGIQSGLSYSGSSSINEFHKKASIMMQSANSRVEAMPHLEMRNA